MTAKKSAQANTFLWYLQCASKTNFPQEASSEHHKHQATETITDTVDDKHTNKIYKHQ